MVIPARCVVEAEHLIPERPGIYMLFFRGGRALLLATSYFDLGGPMPPSVKRRQHLYTGAAENLRRRLKQHMAIVNGSSLRKTLLAIESERGAISSSGTPACQVRGERSLTEWLRRNVLIGLELHPTPLERERQALNRLPSPFNLTLRRQTPYARQLSRWRNQAFPTSDPRRLSRILAL